MSFYTYLYNILQISQFNIEHTFMPKIRRRKSVVIKSVILSDKRQKKPPSFKIGDFLFFIILLVTIFIGTLGKSEYKLFCLEIIKL